MAKTRRKSPEPPPNLGIPESRTENFSCESVERTRSDGSTVRPGETGYEYATASMGLPYSYFSSNNRLILSKLDWLIGFLEAREDEYTTKALNAAHEIRSLMEEL